MTTAASGTLPLPSLAPVEPAQEHVYLPYGLEVPVLLGHLPTLREDAASRGVLVELVVGAAEHPVGHRVVRFVLHRPGQVLPGFRVPALLEQLDAHRAEDHGVVGVLLEQLAKHLRPRGLHIRAPPPFGSFYTPF